LRGQKGLDEGAEVRSFFLFRPVGLAFWERFCTLPQSARSRSKTPVAGGSCRLHAPDIKLFYYPLAGHAIFPAGGAQPIIGRYRAAHDRVPYEHARGLLTESPRSSGLMTK